MIIKTRHQIENKRALFVCPVCHEPLETGYYETNNILNAKCEWPICTGESNAWKENVHFGVGPQKMELRYDPYKDLRDRA